MNNKEKNRTVVKVEPSRRTVLMLVVIFLLFFLGEKLLAIGIVLFLAFILSSFILPMYRWLQSRKVSNAVAIALITIAFIVVILVVTTSIVLPFVLQLERLIGETPDILESVVQIVTRIDIPLIQWDETAVRQALNEYVDSIAVDIIPNLLRGLEGARATFTALADVGGAVLTFITIYAISIYFVTDHDFFVDKFASFFDDKKSKVVKESLAKLESRLSRWIIGEVSLMFVIGVMTWLFLTVLGIPFALPLAVLAGFLEIVPNLGPILSSIPAILIALFQGGPALAAGVAFGYVVIQQLENNLIVPKIMGNATGIHPLFILVGMLFGFSIGGILGALLTVPVLVIGKIAWEFWSEFRRL